MAFSSWKDNIPTGPTFIVLRNKSYLLENIEIKKIEDIVCFIKNTGEIYYIKFNNGFLEKIALIDRFCYILEINVKEGNYQLIKSHKIHIIKVKNGF
jgi:hypothetical protein